MYRIHTRSLLISDVATYIALYVCYICTRARARVFANDETEISKFSPYMSVCHYVTGGKVYPLTPQIIYIRRIDVNVSKFISLLIIFKFHHNTFWFIRFKDKSEKKLSSQLLNFLKPRELYIDNMLLCTTTVLQMF